MVPECSSPWDEVGVFKHQKNLSFTFFPTLLRHRAGFILADPITRRVPLQTPGWVEQEVLAGWMCPLRVPHCWDLAKVGGTLRQDHSHKPTWPRASGGRMLCLWSPSYKALVSPFSMDLVSRPPCNEPLPMVMHKVVLSWAGRRVCWGVFPC